MVKGLIEYKDGNIPFVIDDFQLSLFSEEELVSEFCKEHNNKRNYILYGKCYIFGGQSSRITILVERSLGEICYIKSYVINRSRIKNKIDTIKFESKVLDSIFRYKYHYVDLARDGINLAAGEIEVYNIPFAINGSNYELKYYIGHNNQIGLLDNFVMGGKVSIKLTSPEIEEYYKITLLLERFARLLTSNSKITFERIKLYEGNIPVSEFYSKVVAERCEVDNDVRFCEYQVNKFSSRILNNLAIDLNSKIMYSVPLGHISDYGNMYTPNRFIEELTSFEYLFEKLELQKAKHKNCPLRTALKSMFDTFPEVLSGSRMDSNEISKRIKELRVEIVHGRVYYYDFSDNTLEQYYIIILARLIQKMSFRLIGFSDSEIQEITKHLIAF